MREKDVFAVSVVLAVFFASMITVLGFNPVKLNLKNVKSTLFAVTGSNEAGSGSPLPIKPNKKTEETKQADGRNKSDAEISESDDTELIYGSKGVLLIPSIQVTVPLYEGDVYDNPVETQAIVDAENSAAMFDFEGVKVIAEHVDQTFGNLSKIKVGDTAFVKQQDGSEEEFVCTGNFLGKNVGSALTDVNGASVSKMIKDGVIMYTCTDNWEDVTVTIWERVKANYEQTKNC